MTCPTVLAGCALCLFPTSYCWGCQCLVVGLLFSVTVLVISSGPWCQHFKHHLQTVNSQVHTFHPDLFPECQTYVSNCLGPGLLGYTRGLWRPVSTTEPLIPPRPPVCSACRPPCLSWEDLQGLGPAGGVALSFPFLTPQSSTVAPLSRQFQPPVSPLYPVPSGLNATTITPSLHCCKSLLTGLVSPPLLVPTQTVIL